MEHDEYRYGVIKSLEEARVAADEARREGLLGFYPAACVVLDMALANATTWKQVDSVEPDTLVLVRTCNAFGRLSAAVGFFSSGYWSVKDKGPAGMHGLTVSGWMPLPEL